eukprot:TRINITY_DN1309_c4_g1_i1.p1 TRINITY_DN1309_c4_g1~~TRINITY_DN1309_c4_g1_i1.p1  ORF type:complete len:194 (+),score=30.26 TRINITY_DN1309_c4_g1_i1:187-768(+)
MKLFGVEEASFLVASLAIALHVANYNITAQVEYSTRIITKVFGRHAVFGYALFLVLSALIRDEFVSACVDADANSLVLLPEHIATPLGWLIFVLGFLLNLWTLKALGIKGMYNGDSFGWVMSAPVTDGPYVYWNDPQYVGTVAAMFGYALLRQSANGYALTVVMAVVFFVSVKFVEGPHMNRIYSNKKKSKLY